MTTAVDEKLPIVRKLTRHKWRNSPAGAVECNSPVNPDGPEAAALIEELVEALRRIEAHYTDTGLAAKHMASIARYTLSRAGVTP